MRILDSLSGRLVASLLLVTVMFGLISAATGSITLHREINEAMDSSMQEAARRLLPLVIDDLFGRDVSQSPRKLAEAVPDDDGGRMVFQVRDGAGRVLMHSYGASAEPLTIKLTQGFSEEAGWRVYTEPAVSGTVFVQVAELDTRRNEETFEAATGFLAPMVILIPLSAVIAWLVLARSLRPIATLRGQISARHGDNLAPIHTGELPSELAAIAKSVNSLMQRLSIALDAEKEFTTNAAHELRTPIAGALAQTERLIAETTDEAAGKRPRQIKAALTELAGLSEKLMQLARADAGIAVAGKTADIMAVASLVVADFEQHNQYKGRLCLETPANGKAYAAIDTDALAIVLRNLIENALRHGAEGAHVVVRIGDGSLSVINDGLVVSAPSGLVKRFERGATRAEGSGLGLAIVNKILQQIDATLVLNSPATGRRDGFEATIRFPVV